MPVHKTNLHEKHRENLRKTAVQAGLESFEEHNLLELLLFNVIPRRNTNDIAHNLLNTLGGLEEVLGADKNEIISCENIGENTALFLNVLGSVCEEYLKDCETDEMRFGSVNDAINYIYESLKTESEAVSAVFTLDALHRIKTQRIRKNNGITNSDLLSDAIKDASSGRSVFAFIAFTHPNGILAPDKNELHFVRSAREAFSSIGVKLTEVMIITEHDCRFLSDTDILPKGFFSGQQRP